MQRLRLLLFILFCISGCKQEKPLLPSQAAPVAQPAMPAKAQVVIPKEYEPAVNLRYTSVIGTSEQPTIDGGIINATEGIPVHHETVVAPTDPIISQPASQRRFDDRWATDNKVKVLLAKAATQGKLDYVLNTADAHRLPASVATLPMIESAYRNQAVSPKGAAGVWQLMPSVAQDYGLPNEKRFALEPATQTALTHLETLYETFHNWELTFAAYNAGRGRVKTALQKNPHATSVDELDLPPETKTYVAHLRALNQTFSQWEIP